MVHIGRHIRTVSLKKGISVAELAERISCTRKHVYKIFQKQQLDTRLLFSISKALRHDFFAEYSKHLSYENCLHEKDSRPQ